MSELTDEQILAVFYDNDIGDDGTLPIFIARERMLAVGRSIIAASPQTLPELPTGWRYVSIRQFSKDFGGTWDVQAAKDGTMLEESAYGSNLNEAANACLDKIKAGEKG